MNNLYTIICIYVSTFVYTQDANINNISSLSLQSLSLLLSTSTSVSKKIKQLYMSSLNMANITFSHFITRGLASENCSLELLVNILYIHRYSYFKILFLSCFYRIYQIMISNLKPYQNYLKNSLYHIRPYPP